MTATARALTAYLAVLLSIPLIGRGEELITDRPDFTESPVVVPPRGIQIEGGWTWSDEGEAQETLSGPEMLIRLGLGGRFELRLGLPDVVEPPRGRSGLGDASIGAKWQLEPTAGGWDVGWIGTLSLPTGDAGLTSGEVDPDVIFTIGRQLSHTWSLGTQISAGSQSVGARRLSVIGGTLVLGRRLSERVGMFVELAVEHVEGADTSVLAHHGYTLLSGPGLQFDVHVALGVTDGAPDALFGAGVSWRRRRRS